MRTADYIFGTLAGFGVKHIFLVTGGGAMHLDDAIGREKRLNYVCCLHEQACTMAAEGYARISGLPGVACVTTGPGGTNALTGVIGAWLDSVPMLVVSGQVKTSTMTTACPELKLRQLGDQEINIVDIVRPVTKYAATAYSPADVPRMLADAWRIAQEGRPGPVWLDIPLDVQSAEMPENIPAVQFEKTSPPEPEKNDVGEFISSFLKAERPVVIAGCGVRLAGAEKDFIAFAERLGIPVLTGISGIDLMSSDHPLFFGRPGILGARAANFIMQNSDMLLVLGTRMGIRITGYSFDTVARAAKKIMVDIDENELAKPTFKPDIPIRSDAGTFIRAVMKALPDAVPPKTEWMEYCRRVRRDYPVILPEDRSRKDYVSSRYLPEIVSRNCPENSVVVTGNGTAYTSTFQTFPVRKNMRMFANEGCASMGYGLPAAIGAAFAAGKERTVVCFTGDGSLQMNIQELQTLASHSLNVKLFVYNNAGYLSIKITQNSFFGGNLVGSDPSSGVTLPDLKKIAAAYGLKYFRLGNNVEAERLVPEIFASEGPVVAEVMTDPMEKLFPKAASKRLPDGKMVSSPLEDLFPFLPREEFLKNMLIKPLEDTES